MGNENSADIEPTENGNISGKHGNGSVNGLSANITSNGLKIAVNTETMVQQNGEPLSLELATEPTRPEIPKTVIHKKEVKKGNEDQTDVSLPATNPQPEAANLKRASESLTVPESVTLDPGPEKEKAPESDNGEDSNPEENPVMNFFKTLVTPKITKKEPATPGATKDQVAQVSEPPAVPKGMSYPPPPPPEPPRMEIKGEPAAKPVKPTPKEEPKAAAKEAESPQKKSARKALSKFFSPKTIKDAPAQPAVDVQETPVVPQPVVEVQSENKVEPHETADEVTQPVVEEQTVEEVPPPVVGAEKVDPSKAGTLEAAAKPEPPPPVQEAKKSASKSAFLSRFKPKELLDNMTTKVQAASTSGVRLLRRTTGVAAGPQKASPAPAAAAETVKAREEPKAAAKSSEAVVDKKTASGAPQAGDDAANVPRKLEKRNSIQLFFKHLGQKRNSTDAGVQTEPAPVAPAAEKAK
ncbi:breast carcinoma-amplified sequence 1 isoform X2 [Etheostoma cragini]|uniref:breast carcinoma-amplified sequence 1 isoform X2 n=1 Tax=Etheostoma cragini TaxID=417921 RepID=UPI00155EB461|nr:breast carcinoma-amplified sequence 1 isoform X2 [Etheostoma cragini]